MDTTEANQRGDPRNTAMRHRRQARVIYVIITGRRVGEAPSSLNYSEEEYEEEEEEEQGAH